MMLVCMVKILFFKRSLSNCLTTFLTLRLINFNYLCELMAKDNLIKCSKP